MSTFYVEIELDIDDVGPTTLGVGHYRSHDKAQTAATNIEDRLGKGAAKGALDETYGVDGYRVTVSALRLRTPSEAIMELMTND